MSRQIHHSFVLRFSKPRSTPVQPVTADELYQVEQGLKVTFPAAYVAFLTEYGPIFTPSVLDLVTGGESEQAPKGAGPDVRKFFTPQEISETHRLYTTGGMEAWGVPFATDSMGNLFGFKREELEPRPDDCPVLFFDHDFCKIRQQAAAFDTWLASYLELAK